MLGDKKRKAITAILGPEHGEGESPSHDMGDGHAIAEDLISAIHAKDVGAVVDAFKALFAHCESEPHEEGPHID